MYNCDKLLHNFYEVNIMHIAIDINTELNISRLTDLPKLKLLMQNLKMKINKSELARKFNVDRRAISKYLDGHKPNKNIKMKSNKTELALTFHVDRRTISKYLDSYQPNIIIKKTSNIDAYYDIIKRLL